MRENVRDEIIAERRGAVQWVTFNRPQARNALTWNMYDRLMAVCEAVNHDRDVRAMVLTGAGGKAFIAGTDIAQFREFTSEKQVLDYEAGGNRMMATLESVRVPVIAAIAGFCTGAGAAIAAACDLRIASPSARYGFPIAKTLGNCLSMANTARVVGLVGTARTKDLLMRARLMEAPELLACGALNEVTADEASLLPRAQAMAEEVASYAPLTLWAIKEALRRLRTWQIPDGADADLIKTCYLSKDFHEGVESFLAKRKPNWQGE